jgi:predicted kinase
MNLPELYCPAPPGWRVRWQDLTDEFEWIRAMRECPQDSVFHREGDVWTHVGMVLEALASDVEFRALPTAGRSIVFTAALLHDVAKPACTRTEDGRVTSRGHSQRGAIAARRILWDLNLDFATREQICALVRYHQLPFHLINRPDAQRMVLLISQTARCDFLTLIARADALGRDCSDRDELLTHIALFREYCHEQGCLYGPRIFPSSHSRFMYFRNPGRDPEYRAYEEPRCEVTIMSGLPGAGKDAWVAQYRPELPQISLDQLRDELGAEPTRNQGGVVQAARERARTFLRAGTDFVWNATNISTEMRRQIVDLAVAYEARIRIVYVEATREGLFQQNEARSAIVASAAIARLLDRWEVPDVTEAQNVEWWVCGKRVR